MVSIRQLPLVAALIVVGTAWGEDTHVVPPAPTPIKVDVPVLLKGSLNELKTEEKPLWVCHIQPFQEQIAKLRREPPQPTVPSSKILLHHNQRDTLQSLERELDAK